MRLIVDGRPIPFEPDDSLLVAMLRNGIHPTGGGCLGPDGDEPHCLTTVDGVSYIRASQIKARPGMIVTTNPIEGYPPLPEDDRQRGAKLVQHHHCDVLVIGQGESGQAEAAAARAADKTVITVDVQNGQEAIGIYPGILVVVRTDDAMLHIHPHEVVVATGAAEILPVCPGNELKGLYTGRMVAQLHGKGFDLGRIVHVGTAPDGVESTAAVGELLRFEPKGVSPVETQNLTSPRSEKTQNLASLPSKKTQNLASLQGDVGAVIMLENGVEVRHECDTVALGLGLIPRNRLYRMGRDWNVRVVGEAARKSDIPPCPKTGTLCPCSSVTVDDMQAVWDRGFHEMELVKRATLAGTGPCQGVACLPHIRAFLQDRGKKLQPPFTARPLARQQTIGEIAAGAYHFSTPRTALDAEHRQLGAQMERISGWWRPWNYGDVAAEYWAVREAVGIGDVSTLGKLIVTGADATEALERVYPTKVATLRPGRSRYVLMLNEAGYIMDDGLISCVSPTHYILSTSSSGVNGFERWLRDWFDTWQLDVRLMNITQTLGAISVSGPFATDLLARAGFEQPLRFMRHREGTVASVNCRVYRLSFTGEIGYELHHPADQSAHLWRELMLLGRDLGIKPFGIEAQSNLRLDKGHIIVGQDTDYDSTPRRVHHEWAVKLEKPYFLGQRAVKRTNKIPLDRQLIGLTMETDGDAPGEGAVILHGDDIAGYVTSTAYSRVLGKAVMLGWAKLVDGALPTDFTINGRPATRTDVPFYDKEGNRARA